MAKSLWPTARASAWKPPGDEFKPAVGKNLSTGVQRLSPSSTSFLYGITDVKLTFTFFTFHISLKSIPSIPFQTTDVSNQSSTPEVKFDFLSHIFSLPLPNIKFIPIQRGKFVHQFSSIFALQYLPTQMKRLCG